MADTTYSNIAASAGNETDRAQQGSAGLISLYGNPYLLCKGYIGTVPERYLLCKGYLNCETVNILLVISRAIV